MVSRPGLQRPPTFEYASPHDRRPRRWLLFVVLMAVVLVVIRVAVSMFVPHRVRGDWPSTISMSNLKQIGQAILMYTNENDGAYPDSFATLLLTEDITSAVFISQYTNDTAAQGPTTQAVAAALTTGGHLSYVYVGRGMSVNTPPETVVAYENLASTVRGGAIVLFADGHVAMLDAQSAAKILPPAPSNAPSTPKPAGP